MNVILPYLEKEFKIKSDKNKDYSININFNSELQVKAKELNMLTIESFIGNYNKEYILKNKYFSSCKNIPDIQLALNSILIDDNNIILKEEQNGLKLILKLPHPDCKEIIFPLKKGKKDTNESIHELYELINKLNERILPQETEIRNLKGKILSQEKEINDLKTKIIIQNNEIDELKKEIKAKNVKNDFIETYNPWSKEALGYGEYNIFYYDLKEKDFLAEKTKIGDFIHIIRGKNNFEIGKIYKLEFIINYINEGDFDIGFGDLKIATDCAWLRGCDSCVCITNQGLYISSKKISDISITKYVKKYTFIIDIFNANFILYMDGIKSGEYNHIFQNNNIYPLAAIRNIGNSVYIKTYEKYNFSEIN